jgi:hypothetical protein
MRVVSVAEVALVLVGAVCSVVDSVDADVVVGVLEDVPAVPVVVETGVPVGVVMVDAAVTGR